MVSLGIPEGVWLIRNNQEYAMRSIVLHVNRVSCFNAGHIFVDFFMIMHRTVMKFGMNIEAKHINDL